MIKEKVNHILLSRTDSIGDVVLTLPMASWLKKNFPSATIYFLGRNYTKSVVQLSSSVDEFINYDELKLLTVSQQIAFINSKRIDCVIHVFPRSEISTLMKKASVKWRIGTKNRMYHWFHCNSLINLSRKHSDLHESQLNLKLLQPLGLAEVPKLSAISKLYSFTNISPLNSELKNLLSNEKQNIILHPKSKGSAREWGIKNFISLINNLPKEKYKIFISGTAEEGKMCRDIFDQCTDLIDLTGKLDLSQFISFISSADGIVAASTGPLHLAAALGKKAVGLFSPMRPIHPGRWKPIGERAIAISKNEQCSNCRKSSDCLCIREIAVQDVISALESL